MLRIIVPYHNARPWLPRCIESIKRQRVQQWRCHLADDGSDDQSAGLVRELTADDSRFVCSANSTRLYQCGSYQRLLQDPSWDVRDICVSVDADDYLPDDEVFSRIHEAYSDRATWLTWGNYSRTDGEPGISGPLENASQVRNLPWTTSHLRTWKLFLWRKILLADFLGPDGEILRAAGDLAWMFPMIEMAGDRRVKFLDSINYVYNRSNPISNFRIRTDEQLRNARFLRAKPPYAQLPNDLSDVS